jgi:hypothetical protein
LIWFSFHKFWKASHMITKLSLNTKLIFLSLFLFELLLLFFWSRWSWFTLIQFYPSLFEFYLTPLIDYNLSIRAIFQWFIWTCNQIQWLIHSLELESP